MMTSSPNNFLRTKYPLTSVREGIGIQFQIPECIPQFLELKSGMHSDFENSELELESIPIFQKGIGIGIEKQSIPPS